MQHHPQEKPTGHCCAGFRIVLGVIFIALMAALVGAIVYVNTIYLRKEFDEQAQLMIDRLAMNKKVVARMAEACTGPNGISRIAGVSEIQFAPAVLLEWEPSVERTDGTCQYQSRIKLEVIPCNASFPECSYYDYPTRWTGIKVYCSKVVQNNFEYFLVNEGTSFKDIFQLNSIPPSAVTTASYEESGDELNVE